MLIRFIVENFRSFKEETVLNMIATSHEAHLDHVINNVSSKDLSVLRVGAMYGANASGKSNLVEAISFARDLITEGTRSNQAIPINPFKFGKEVDTSSKFEFTFTHEGNLYTYGFKSNPYMIEEEWLFGTPTDRKREIRYFERVTSAKGKVKVEFGPIVTGSGTKNKQFLEFVVKGTRPNQLFLREALDRNVEIIKPVVDWFTEILQVVGAESTFSKLQLVAHADTSFATYLAEFLHTAGTGIEGIETERLPFDFDKYDEVSPEEKERIKSDLLKGLSYVFNIGGKQFGVTLGDDHQPVLVGIKTIHKTSDGRKVLFDLEEESEGTQRLVHLIPALAMSKSTERVWVIDELDRRLHPLLTRMFLEVYLEADEDQPKGQLIFTTHDTNLLDLELLRKDEVWFIEKDDKGVSHLYSLADFNIRPGLKIAKGYLNGRFGAIPFIGDITKLGWATV